MNKRAFTIIELLVVILVFIVTLIFLAPVVQLTRERANNINCANNLRMISLGLHLYAADHNERFPPDLTSLYPDYVKEAKAFDCPASKVIGTPEKPDYDYAPGLTELSPQSEAIVYDATGNHRKMGGNLLRINGSVELRSRLEGKSR